MRLQKKIAESGCCSRRTAEELIVAGFVAVNGIKAVIGQNVEARDEITISGKPLKAQTQKIYIALNKPKGYTCTNRRFAGEKNIFDLIKLKARLFVVGRLDKDSRGLVILTNDGEYAQKTTHPRYHHEKVYEVAVEDVKPSDVRVIISCLTKGVRHEREFLVAKKATYLGNNKFRLILTQGKKRQIRRMFTVLGYSVSDLLRTQIGNVKLGDLKEGEWKEITH